MAELLLSGALLLLLDQTSKQFVIARAAGSGFELGVLRIRTVASRRRIYASDSARALYSIVWLTALAAAILLHSSGTALTSRIALVGTGMALGGAAGNLIDMIRTRSVIDFIDLGWWPVFNIADAAIIGGLVIAFWPA